MSRLDTIRNAAKEAVKTKQEQAAEKNTQFSVETDAEFYRAFSAAPTGDPPLHLVIFTKKGIAVSPLYSMLYDFVFDDKCEFIGLVFPHCRVKLYGKNLGDLIIKLSTHRVEFIYEYGSTGLRIPPDHDPAKDPVITKVEMEGAQIEPTHSEGDSDD